MAKPYPAARRKGKPKVETLNWVMDCNDGNTGRAVQGPLSAKLSEVVKVSPGSSFRGHVMIMHEP